MKTKPTYQELEKENEDLKQKLASSVSEELLNAKEKAEASEERYRDLFNKNPLSLWEEDFSEVMNLLNDKKREGVTNFKEYFDKNPDFVAKCSASIKIISINKATLKLLKYKSENDLVNNISAVFNEKSFETFKNELLAILGDKIFFTEETEFVCSTGEVIQAVVQFQQIHDLKKVIFAITDISEAKKAEKEIKKQNKLLKELNATKDKFFSIIAHDLRSPFSTMLGFSQILIRGFDKFDVPKQKKLLGILNSNLQNTYKLLENLLLWSRTQKENIEFITEKENLYLLSVETLDLLRQTAINKSIKLTNKIPEDIYVWVDKNMILTIFRNLISNAVKFTPKGGTVEIGVEKIGYAELKVHEFSLHKIYVKDSGVGIPKEIQSKLFDITKNTSIKGTDGETGTGLGLILCKEFIEKHGGKIWIESEVAKGSKFIFTL